MTYAARTVEMSVDNYHSSIETFLRSMKAIHNDENVLIGFDWDTPRHGNTILVTITPITQTQEVKSTVDHTVH